MFLGEVLKISGEVLKISGEVQSQEGQIDTIYLDMSKAFDRINHKSLLQKMTNSVIGGNLLNWFHSYLTDRHQRVVVTGATSDPLLVCSGVPQGSILGPTPFLLYLNNLPDVVKSSEVAMFVDDTKVFLSIRSQDDVESLQTNLANLEY